MDTRVLIAAAATMFTALVVTIAVASGIFIRRFDAIEASQTDAKAQQAVLALEADLRQLAISNRDYSEWDDAYDYVRERDNTFVDVNFTYESLDGMQVDVAAVFAADGSLIYGGEVAHDEQAVKPASAELLDTFRAMLPRSRELRELNPTRRLAHTTQGLMAFAAVEIRRSDRSEPTGALMCFGRILRGDEIERVNKTSRLPVAMIVLPAASPLPAEITAWVNNPAARDSTYALRNDASHITGYGLLRDVAGQPIALLATRADREIAAVGRDTTYVLMGTIAAGLLVFCLSTLILLLRLRRSWADRAASESKAEYLAGHDTLTKLPNRPALRERLPVLMETAALREQSLYLMHVDLDHFKNVNDTRDHAFGDRALCVIADRLAALCAADDLLFRVGGDEFVLIGMHRTERGWIRAHAQRVLDAFVEPLTVDADTLLLTASIGIATYPQDALDAESLLKHADIALYEAKDRGRNTYQLFSSDMNVQRSEHVMLEQALRRALNTDQIYVEYQPLVDLQTGLLVSFEALARWHHPELGQIPPSRFIPVAEKSGLIVQLGEQVLRTVIAQLQQWQSAGVPLARVAINVAPVQFELTAFSTLVHELVLQYDVDPKWLAFEVTESAWLQNSAKHIVMIDTLRHAGSRIYIDDFGTGFSNLSNLKTLPVDALKIDQAFVRALLTDEGDAAIVGSIISMADKLRLSTIAEGIETAEHAARLRDMGCQYGQGYYFSKPIPATHCRALLEQLGETRRFTETVMIRAFRAAKSA